MRLPSIPHYPDGRNKAEIGMSSFIVLINYKYKLKSDNYFLLNYHQLRNNYQEKNKPQCGGVGEGDFYPWGGCILMIHPIPGGQNRASGRVDHLQDPRFFAYLAWSPLTPGFWGG